MIHFAVSQFLSSSRFKPVAVYRPRGGGGGGGLVEVEGVVYGKDF